MKLELTRADFTVLHNGVVKEIKVIPRFSPASNEIELDHEAAEIPIGPNFARAFELSPYAKAQYIIKKDWKIKLKIIPDKITITEIL